MIHFVPRALLMKGQILVKCIHIINICNVDTLYMYVYNMKLFCANCTFDERATPIKICAYYKYI